MNKPVVTETVLVKRYPQTDGSQRVILRIDENNYSIAKMAVNEEADAWREGRVVVCDKEVHFDLLRGEEISHGVLSGNATAITAPGSLRILAASYQLLLDAAERHGWVKRKMDGEPK